MNFQEDGTWTDVPRCIEHEPGKDEQGRNQRFVQIFLVWSVPIKVA